MKNNGNRGISRLASVLDSRSQEHSEFPLCLDFAEVREDYSLLPNTFGIPIPPSGYSVCRQLMIGNAGSEFCGVNAGGYVGSAYLPESMRKLKPGDRVLIAWVQDEPVVIDIVYKATKL